MDYFASAVGQDGLKKELYEAYVGAQRAGIRAPHGLLISPPGYGKSDQFVPGVAEMTGFKIVGPYGISRNMTLDDLFCGPLGCAVALAQAYGEKPMVVLEEFSNIGIPNTGRLLTLLSEGYYTTLKGEVFSFGIPGIEWVMVACTNDDGNFLGALKSRLTYFRFGQYSLEELAEIGARYAWDVASCEIDQKELLVVAGQVESPREMINRVIRMLSLNGLGQKADAAALVESLRLDADGLHADTQRTLVALFDLKGKSPIVVLSKKLKARTSTVSGWCSELVEKGYLHPPKSGAGGGHVLTFLGQQKAATLKAAGVAGA